MICKLKNAKSNYVSLKINVLEIRLVFVSINAEKYFKSKKTRIKTIE